MNRRQILTITSALGLVSSASAWAQPAPSAPPLDLGSREGTSAVSGLGAPRGDIGVQLSETSIMHVGVTAEAGYDSNVFYDGQGNERGSAMTRVIPSILITNMRRDGGPAPTSVIYSLGASLVYREYINSNTNVTAQRAFNPTVTGLLGFGNGQQVSFGIADAFSRLEDPPYGESSGSIVHDYNLASADLRVAPGGGRLAAALRYANAWDHYETTGLEYASNLGHDFLLDGSWKWLPKTAIFVQGGLNFIHYTNADLAPPALARHDSTAWRALGGLRGLITAKVNASVGLGYSNATYDGGAPGPSAGASFAANALLGYQPTPLTHFGLTYSHGFRNSPVLGSFYDLDTASLSLDQMLGGRVVLGVTGRYEYRRYHGITSLPEDNRKDNVFVAGAHFDVFISRWFYAGAVYALTVDDSNLSAAQARNLGANYVKHQVLARIGITY